MRSSRSPVSNISANLRSPTGRVAKLAKRTVKRLTEQDAGISALLGVTAGMRGQGEVRCPGEAVFQFSMDGILLMDGSQRIQTINQTAERMFGLESSKVAGQFLRTVLPVRLQRAVEEEIRVLIRRRGSKPRPIETIGRRSDGEEFPIELVLAKVPAQEGCLFIAMVRDSSKYRQLEQQVLKAAEEAHKTIARELHDSLGSMLTAIQIRAHVLATGLRCAGLEGASGEAGELSQQLFQVSKQLRILVHGLHPLDIGPAWLIEGMHGLAERVRNTGRMKCRLLLPQQPVNLPAEFALHLRRIAEEATHNALRHSEAASLTLMFKCENGEFVLRVSDNGRGFDSAEQSDGHGLLTMHYRAQSMGGRLILQTRPGAGVKVTCVIPCPERETVTALTRASKPGG